LGSARLLGGDARGAEAAPRAAIQLAPGLAKAGEGLVRALRAQGRTQDARAALSQWLELEPKSARALALLEDS
jgi:cytochrome c-type biogenesis protein CcmH/NrfG